MALWFGRGLCWSRERNASLCNRPGQRCARLHQEEARTRGCHRAWARLGPKHRRLIRSPQNGLPHSKCLHQSICETFRWRSTRCQRREREQTKSRSSRTRSGAGGGEKRKGERGRQLRLTDGSAPFADSDLYAPSSTTEHGPGPSLGAGGRGAAMPWRQNNGGGGSGRSWSTPPAASAH